ncbi:hypothetical protein, partial [Escherichia coli]|uniref:hypothetical protein n=1 Tax=Escherichia coli TaxID=562 RepID=UPI00278C0C5E
MSGRRNRDPHPGQLAFDLWGLDEQTADESLAGALASEVPDEATGEEHADEQVRGSSPSALGEGGSS